MERAPVGTVAAGLAVGIFLADAWGRWPVEFVAASVAAAGVLSTFATQSDTYAVSSRGVARSALTVVLLVCGGALGYSRVVYRDAARWRQIRSASRPLEIIGHINAIAGGRRYIRVTLDRLVLPSSGGHIAGSILLFLSLEEAGTLNAGSRVTVQTKLQVLPRQRNPGDFDYGRYLLRRGVRGIAYPVGPAVSVLRRPAGPMRMIAQVRVAIEKNIRRTVRGPEAASILTALLLGDRSDIDPDLKRDFTATGLVHVLAVSGLHVMVVGFVFFNIAGTVLRRSGVRWALVEKVRVPATALLLMGYMLLTGSSASVVRAVIMAVALLSSTVVRRNTNSLNSLFTAAAVLLVVSPWSLFEPGFQLSVSAVASILTLHRRITDSKAAKRVSRYIGRGTLSSLSVTVAATAGVAPVLLSHFGELSLAGLLLNLPAVPLTAAALVSGTLSAASGNIAAISGMFGRASETTLDLLVSIVRAGSSHLGFAAVKCFPSTYALVAAGAALLSVVLWNRHYRWKIAILVPLSLLAGRTDHLARHLQKRLDFVFYDVGQGDASLLVTTSGSTMLVDAGDARRGANASRRWIIPDLRKRNIPHIDLLVLSHAHADHIGAVPYLLRHVGVRRIAFSQNATPSSLLSTIQKIADSLSTPVAHVGAGDTLFLDAAVSIQVLWPPVSDDHIANENDRSVTLRVSTPAGAVLLAGDVEKQAEAGIAARFAPLLPSAIIKVPHHGSRTSSTPVFVSFVAKQRDQQRIAVFSVGKNNSYGLPDSEIVRRWKMHRFHPIETDEVGAAWFVLSESGILQKPWKHDSLRTMSQRTWE